MNFVRYRGYLWVYRSEAIVFAPALVSTSLEMTRLSTVLFDFIMLFCKFGRSRLAHGGSPFAHALVSTSLEVTERWSITQGLRAGRGRPALPRRGTYSKQILAHRGSLSGGRGSPLPFKAFPFGGRWIAEATAKARRMRGRDMTNVTYKPPPHQSLRDSFPPRGSLEQSAYADIYGYTVPKRSCSLPPWSRLRSR